MIASADITPPFPIGGKSGRPDASLSSAVGARSVKGAAQRPPSGPAVEVNGDALSPVKTNSTLADHPVDYLLYVQMLEFNRSYTDWLSALHEACNGHPHVPIPLMYDLKYKALDLMDIPLGKGEEAGPRFEYAGL